MTTAPFTVERTASGRYRVTHMLHSVWVSEAEALAAATDPAAAAALLARLEDR